MENIGGGAFGRPVEQPSDSDPHKHLSSTSHQSILHPFSDFCAKSPGLTELRPADPQRAAP